VDVATQMEKLAAVYLEERRKLEASEAGRRQREGMVVNAARKDNKEPKEKADAEH
jgi:hypothetical protein